MRAVSLVPAVPAATEMAVTSAERDLAALHAEIRACTRCVVAGHLPRALPIVDGKASDRIMVVGQAPGEVELTTGLPFSGRAGAELRRWLSDAGIGWPPYRTSITKCFPGKARSGVGDRRPSAAEVALCAPWLERELALVRPRVVLLVGALAIGRVWGKASLKAVVGGSRRRDDRLLVPLPHPSGASRWLNDPVHRTLLRRALGILRREARAHSLDGSRPISGAPVPRAGPGLDGSRGRPQNAL